MKQRLECLDRTNKFSKKLKPLTDRYNYNLTLLNNNPETPHTLPGRF
jgi:hypothetical protein